jgi:hypothetical protein
MVCIPGARRHSWPSISKPSCRGEVIQPILACLLFLISPALLVAADVACKTPVKNVTCVGPGSLSNTGNQDNANTTVVVQYMNRLRFDEVVGTQITVNAAPTLPTSLIPTTFSGLSTPQSPDTQTAANKVANAQQAAHSAAARSRAAQRPTTPRPPHAAAPETEKPTQEEIDADNAASFQEKWQHLIEDAGGFNSDESEAEAVDATIALATLSA